MKRSMRSALAWMLFLLAGPLLAQEPAKLRVKVFPGAQNLPLFAGVAKGFFAKRGLAVEPLFTVNSVVFRDLRDVRRSACSESRLGGQRLPAANLGAQSRQNPERNAARQPIDREVVIKGEDRRQLLTLGDVDKSGIRKVHRHVAILLHECLDARHVGRLQVDDGHSPVEDHVAQRFRSAGRVGK